jgi:hypothetical protein
MKNEITFARQHRTAPRAHFMGGHHYAGPIESALDDYRRTVGPVRWQFVGVAVVCIAFALVLFGIGVVTP